MLLADYCLDETRFVIRERTPDFILNRIDDILNGKRCNSVDAQLFIVRHGWKVTSALPNS